MHARRTNIDKPAELPLPVSRVPATGLLQCKIRLASWRSERSFFREPAGATQPASNKPSLCLVFAIAKSRSSSLRANAVVRRRARSRATRWRVTTTEHAFAFSRHELPEICLETPPSLVRGRREGRVRAAPAVSCAIMRMARGAHEHTGSAGASRPSLRNGFTAYFALFPENGSFASVALKELSHLADLTPAPRRQDQTTSPYASATLVRHGLGVHRILPRVSDDGQRPSSRGETGAVMPQIWVEAEAEYFRFSEIHRLTPLLKNRIDLLSLHFGPLCSRRPAQGGPPPT